MFSGKFFSCFKLAGKWAPDAITAAYEGLSIEKKGSDESPVSCASEVVRKMGEVMKKWLWLQVLQEDLG